MLLTSLFQSSSSLLFNLILSLCTVLKYGHLGKEKYSSSSAAFPLRSRKMLEENFIAAHFTQTAIPRNISFVDFAHLNEKLHQKFLFLIFQHFPFNVLILLFFIQMLKWCSILNCIVIHIHQLLDYELWSFLCWTLLCQHCVIFTTLSVS